MKDNNTKTLSNYRIKKIMQMKGIKSVYELAIRTGIPRTTLSGILNTNKIPNETTIQRLCNGLGMSIKEFYNIMPEEEKIKNQINDFAEAFTLLKTDEELYRFLEENIEKPTLKKIILKLQSLQLSPEAIDLLIKAIHIINKEK